MKGGYGFRLEYIGDWERVGWDLGIWRSGLGLHRWFGVSGNVLHGGLMHIWLELSENRMETLSYLNYQSIYNKRSRKVA
jgi:hypothetical protein